MDGAPTYLTNQINGLPAVQFGGGGAFGYNGSLGLSGQAAFTGFVVASQISTSGEQRVFQFGDISAGTGGGSVAFDTTSAGFRFNNGNRLLTPAFSTDYHLGIWQMTTGSTYGTADYALDGVLGTQTSVAGSGNTINLADDGYLVGRGLLGNGNKGNWFNGMVAEVLLYDRALSMSELGQVGYYLGRKYGLLDVPTGSTVPGGFAPNTPASGLLYHLDASVGVSTDGLAVTSWADQGHAGNNFAQSDTDKQPVLLAGGVGGNGLPAIRFDGTVDYDLADQLVLSDSTSPQTIVVVNSALSQRMNDGMIGRNDGDLGIRQSGDGWRTDGPADFTSPTGSQMFVNGEATSTVAVQTPHILSATRATGATFAETGLGNYFRVSGQGPRPYHGDIAEVLAFDRVLNQAELRILENHLSAKYDISLAANDLYAGDDPARGDYDRGVFGVGRVDSDNFVLGAGADGMGIVSDTLEDGNWLLAGHNAPTNAWVTDDVPGGLARWQRVWYLDATGDTPATMLAFDHHDGELAVPDPDRPLALLYSPTNDFEFSILAEDPTVYGGLVMFDLAAGGLQNGYYTLATIPEPSTLALVLPVLLALGVWRRRRSRLGT